MYTSIFILLFTLATLLPAPLPATQTSKQTTSAPNIQLLTRSTRRRESARFSYGGTVTLVGAPRGSVTVEGWYRNDVDFTADIEVTSEKEIDLVELARVNNFVFVVEMHLISFLPVGTQVRSYMLK
jgi:hypothetical protein